MDIAKLQQFLGSRSMPPLPPATLVIDMRGKGDDLIKMLQVEVKNLTEEMQQQDGEIWSYLSGIITYETPNLLSYEDIQALRNSDLSQYEPSYRRPIEDLNEEPPQFYPDFEQLIDKIDRIRNIRHNALSALGKSGTLGQNAKVPGVRVLF